MDCLQHVCRDAARRAVSSAIADTCISKPKSFIIRSFPADDLLLRCRPLNKSQNPLRYLVADRSETGRRPARSC